MARQRFVREVWSSHLVFLLAAIGAAVGLGNIWKFPYTAGVSGGGAFVLVYVAAVLAVAVPIVMAELLIGRRGRSGPVASLGRLAAGASASRRWRFVGWLNLAAVFLILSFYSVVAGWALAYVPRLAAGRFAGASAAQVAGEFEKLLASPLPLACWHGLFLAATAAIVSLGLRDGIERAVRVLMPVFFLMLLVLLAYAASAGDFTAALCFLFAPDFASLDANVVLVAIGQAFFSVSVAMGLMIVYGASMPRHERIPSSALVISLADTGVALLAGLVIFPLVIANGLDPAEGPGLIFVTLPVAFGAMPAGAFFGALFFVLLALAAFTSSIAILEALISWALERGVARRGRLVALAGLGTWLLGLPTVLSFSRWADVRPLGGIPRYADSTVFDIVDDVASNFMLPIGGILIALFAGWVLPNTDTREELGLPAGARYRTWRFLVRWVAPVAIGSVLIANAR